PAGNQGAPPGAPTAAGDFVGAGESGGQAGGGYGVYARRYGGAGAAQGNEFLVNTFTAGDQVNGDVAAGADGDFVVVWQSPQDGSGRGVYGQRFGVPAPRVTAAQVNGGAAQRSRVTTLGVTFDREVSFAGGPAAAFTLVRNGDSAAVTFTATAGLVGGVTVVTITNFTGSAAQFGSLADGRYTLTALAGQVSTAGVTPLDGNGDGTPGD